MIEIVFYDHRSIVDPSGKLKEDWFVFTDFPPELLAKLDKADPLNRMVRNQLKRRSHLYDHLLVALTLPAQFVFDKARVVGVSGFSGIEHADEFGTGLHYFYEHLQSVHGLIISDNLREGRPLAQRIKYRVLRFEETPYFVPFSQLHIPSGSEELDHFSLMGSS